MPVETSALVRYDGVLSSATPGWEAIHAEAGAWVVVPFEGCYASKGGRIQSPWIDLGKRADRAGYYRLLFEAQTAAPCYWWVDFEDAQGQALPDVNSAVYPHPEVRSYDQMLVAPAAARRLRLAFLSQAGVSVRDIVLQEATPAEAAAWCDRLYAQLPPLACSPPGDAFARLPKTAAALRNGTPWRIVMLGDSIMNDSCNSVFQALVQRDFPASRLEFVASVRGSTGCGYYQAPEPFEAYVARHLPNLVLIGGISNLSDDPDRLAEGLQAITKVVGRTQRLGAEVALLSPAHSEDWRPADLVQPGMPLPVVSWDEDTRSPLGNRRLRWSPYRDVAHACGIAFWNFTAPLADALAASRKPHGYFNRDTVHNNDRGKQLIGRVLQRCFLTAANVG